ncbi:hypothetical protein [uncultured Eudoraea sp.]|uniref:hypothetical protein n=1 Tax=uncultured Eudoraea sp. TaxID=1035614 RepID=UPI00262D96DD|nr:hypothetical protein [uncultured Eudoraea sp.]
MNSSIRKHFTMRNLGFAILSVLLFSIGCTDIDDKVDTINIRINNSSSINFDEVQVASNEELYTNIAPGDYSDYLVYETAYTYAFIEIKSGEEVFVLQPIDFVGEDELPIGFYTYSLNINEEGEVVLQFIVD